MTLNALIVLGHEIQFPSYELSDSSKARSHLLYNLIATRMPNQYIVLFMGKGRLQGDCPFSISQCMYNYFSSTYFPIKNFYIDLNSMDTVGDAVFSHKFVISYPNISKVYVITSDWHLLRVSTIFNAVHLPSQYEITYCTTDESSKIPNNILQTIKIKETRSLNQFTSDFHGHTSAQDWLTLLKTTHPLYIDK